MSRAVPIHLEREVRRVLAEWPSIASTYTVNRIAQSYGHMPDRIGQIRRLRQTSALDAGCGAGFDTFALAQYFDSVTGVDPDEAAIAEATRIARAANVDGLEFIVSTVEEMGTGRFDYVYCNLISHNATSRLRLIQHLASALNDRGGMYLSEINEGYGPMELDGAIESRDGRESVLRIAQVLNGFLGSGFRFYVSENIESIGRFAGLTLLGTERQRWRDLTSSTVSVWERSGTSPAGSGSIDDPDYTEIDAPFARTRELFRGAMVALRNGRLAPDERRAIEAAARERNTYAPFLLFVLMADQARRDVLPLVPSASSPAPIWLAARRRLLRAQPRVEWENVSRLFQEFKTLVASAIHSPT